MSIKQNIEKNFSISLEITKSKYGEEHKSRYDYSLALSDDVRMSEIITFLDAVKKLWRKAINAAKDCENYPHIEMDIHQYVYNRETKSMESFDRWYLRDKEDITTDKDEAGIYLRPDTRYTSENRDMFIGRNVLHDMAEYMG